MATNHEKKKKSDSPSVFSTLSLAVNNFTDSFSI